MRMACAALITLLLAQLPHTSISQSTFSQHQRCTSLNAPADFEPCWTALVCDPSAMPALVGFIAGVLARSNSDDSAALGAALRVLDAALEKHPDNANLWFTHANALRAQGARHLPEEHAGVLSVFSRNIGARVLSPTIPEQLPFRSAGRRSEALRSYSRAVGALPVHVDALHNAAALLAESSPSARCTPPPSLLRYRVVKPTCWNRYITRYLSSWTTFLPPPPCL